MIPTLREECFEFLNESNGNYLVKNLPKKYQGFARVKVRLGRTKNQFEENFNQAFESRKKRLHQSGIFAYPDITWLEPQSEAEPFYIFPINGYQLIFNPVVKNSKNDYDFVDDMHISQQIITDQLQISYQSGTLLEAMEHKCEIIIYGIPYYYAIRATLIDDYKQFFRTDNWGHK